MNDIKNNSLNKSYGRNRMISELDSLQFYHNLTINKIGEIFFDNIIGNENEDNLSINKEKSINKNILKAKKNINNNSNLLSFSSENDNNNNNNSYNNNSNIINYKNKNNIIYIKKKSFILNGKEKNNKAKLIIKDGINKNFYFDKIYYKNLDDIFLKIKEIQAQIVTFLHQKEYNNNSYYKNYSSSSSLNIDIDANENNNSDIGNIKFRDGKNNFNNYEIENNDNFNIEPKDNNIGKNSDKLIILKKLLIKNNKKLNNELKNNVNEYYEKNNKLNRLINITKKKLPLKIIKIIKEHLKPIFIDIYQYNTIDYIRKKILLKLFNNINSKLKRCFEIWSDRPINLLNYKSRNYKY